MKKGKFKESQRRWTKEETDKFCEILADPRNNYAASLDKLALKKSSNNELFKPIKNTFDEELNDQLKELIHKRWTSYTAQNFGYID